MVERTFEWWVLSTTQMVDLYLLTHHSFERIHHSFERIHHSFEQSTILLSESTIPHKTNPKQRTDLA